VVGRSIRHRCRSQLQILAVEFGVLALATAMRIEESGLVNYWCALDPVGLCGTFHSAAILGVFLGVCRQTKIRVSPSGMAARHEFCSGPRTKKPSDKFR
jgi:hypothetical protein